MEGIVDTLKTTTIGFTGTQVSCLDLFPDIVSVCVGLATFAYLIIKIRKELYGKRNN